MEDMVEQQVVNDMDDISQLIAVLKNDILYRMLQRAGLEQNIIHPNMSAKLKAGLNYRPADAAELTGVNEGTLRGWLNGKDSNDLPVYINAYKENKFHILDAEAVFRVRLIYLVQKELKYSLNNIAGIATGKGITGKVIPQNEEILNQLQEVRDANNLLEKQNKVLLSMISVLFEQDSNGEWKLKNHLPLLENNETLKQMKETIDGLNKQVESLETELQKEKESKIDVSLEVVKSNMLYKKAEYMALEKRSVLEKILNRKPTAEEINKYFEELKKDID